jgi:glycosyltransferase involved in cell wall biosynthesis
MHVLFIHDNFPAQFRHVAPWLAREAGWKCTFLSQHGRGSLPGVEHVRFKPRSGARLTNHYCTRTFENQVGNAHAVFDALKGRSDIRPDLVVAHSGFGSSIFLPLLYDAPIINLLEYYYQPIGQSLGYRPEQPVSELDLMRAYSRNAMHLLDLVQCTRAWTPTEYQRDLYPPEFRSKIEVIFDGIPIERFHRQTVPGRRIPGAGEIPADHRIVTYVTRGFELIRGFDIFMKVAKRVYERYPSVTFLVAGRDTLHYGSEKEFITAPTFREHVLSQDRYDLPRFRFVPDNSPDLLSVGDAHIYLTEPFIASWSMVEAMACGAVVVASDQACVREYITHRVNGLLCPFFDVEAIADQVVRVLEDPAAHRHLGDAAAETVRAKYSSEIAYPRLRAFFENVAATGPRRPSHRAEPLVRDGAWKRLQRRVTTNTPVTAPLATAGSVLHGGASRPVAEEVRAAAEKAVPEPQWLTALVDLVKAAGGAVAIPGHPADLSRFLGRVGEWAPKHVVLVGNPSPELTGMMFLITRAAARAAEIVVGVPGAAPPPEFVPILRAAALDGQRVVCVHSAGSPRDLGTRVRKAAAGRPDVVFLDGLRPYAQVRSDYECYRQRMRKNGLLAWNGIERIAPPDPEHDGGQQLWREMKRLYPHNAEYLSGVNEPQGGIGVLRLA